MDKRTTEIVTRFANSCVETERFYDNLIEKYPGFEKLKPVRHFLSELKAKGEDKYFTIGTSVHSLIISRSVDQGLRADQKFIRIDAISEEEFEVSLREGGITYRSYIIGSFDDFQLRKLIDTLKNTLVD